MYQKKYFNILIFLICMLVAIPVANYGLFLDSKIYFLQANTMWDKGIVDGVSEISQNIGKFEPLFLCVLWLQKFLLLFDNKDFMFILLNLSLVNFMTVSISRLLVRNEYFSKTKLLILVPILLLSYYSYSNNIYIWRTIYAVYFLIACIVVQNKLLKLVFILTSVLFHNGICIFILLYFISCFLYSLSKNKMIFSLLSFLLGCVLLFMYNFFMNSFALNLISNPEHFQLSVSSSFLIYMKRIIINIYLLMLLYSISSKVIINNKLYYYCIFLILLSSVFFINWQVSWRLSVPAFILSPIFILFLQKNNGIKFLFSLTIIPGVILFYSLFNHSITIM